MGLLHDIGKYSDAFQKRLAGGTKVDHSTAGAYEALKKGLPMEAFAIAGHHGGLPNRGQKGELEGRSLFARINRAKQGLLEEYSEWEKEVIIDNYEQINCSDTLSASYVFRMLFSCLVDADYIDTEQFMIGNIERGKKADMNAFAEALNEYISSWFPPKGLLNELRCKILKSAMDKGERSTRGLFTMTVPTGGGKTISSLGFAVNHARKNNLRRIIYVIPYTSIIEQNAEVFSHILGNENVLECHSNVDEEEWDGYEFKVKATENWDMPVIVTTAVQFFESFYGNKPSKCRKLHNCANSVIIFDEAQMLPIPYLKPCVRLFCELVKNFQSSIVLCTATQPALNEMISKYLPEYTVPEICPSGFLYDEAFKRVSFEHRGHISVDDLVKEINSKNQVLCIVNSKKAAIEIYEKLEDDCYYLTTNLYPNHRKRILNIIKERLNEGKRCRVVATSLIEAGVDVDFPIVYREIAGLDSIIQAAGRCNREGKKPVNESKVVVFECEIPPPELFTTQIAVMELIYKKYEDITSQDAINDYFSLLFHLKGDSVLDCDRILERTEENFPFESIAADFKLIGENTKNVYIPNEENQNEISRLREGYANKADYRKLQQYCVSVYEFQFKKLLEAGSVELITDSMGILINPTGYSETKGLLCEVSNGNAIFL